MKIAGAILAAGMSTRMGCNKLLLPYNGHTIFQEVLFQLLRSDVDDIVVVVGFERGRIEKLTRSSGSQKVAIVCNPDYKRGRAGSIRCAVRNAKEDCDALLFMVADKPTVAAELVNRAIGEFKRMRPDILYVLTPAGRGHPIIFSGKLFGELARLRGDRIGERIIEKHRDKLAELPDDQVQVDVDSQADYESLLAGDAVTARFHTRGKAASWSRWTERTIR